MLPQILVISGLSFLSVGTSYRLPRRESTVWVSNAKVAEAQLLGQHVILKSRMSGSFFVSGLGTAPDPQKFMALEPENFRALQRCSALQFHFKDSGRIEWAGNFDLSSIKNCAFRELQLPLAQQLAWTSLFMETERALARQGVRIIRSAFVDGLRHLEIATTETRAGESIAAMLGELRPFYHLEFRPLPQPGRTLVFQLSLFEFSRRKAQALGVSLPTHLKVQSLQGPTPNLATAEGGPLSVGADFGESLGLGKILAQPQIRTKPGEKASFQSGGEIPIPNRSLHSSSTTWKNYGLLIELEPDATLQAGDPEISLRFKAEFSEPDLSTAVGGIPGMLTRRLESRFDLRAGEETILTTLLQSRRGRNQNGVLGLGQIPLVGLLFAARQDDQSSSELWFALKPSWEDIHSTGDTWQTKNSW